MAAFAVAADRAARPRARRCTSLHAKGAKVHSPVTVKFGLKGNGIAPAGVKFDKHRHHHLLVDTDLSELKLDAPMPATDKIVHFGKGQTETTLTLTPGKHTLQLIFADYLHQSFDPPLHSKKITITVNDAMRAILHIDMDAFYASVRSRSPGTQGYAAHRRRHGRPRRRRRGKHGKRCGQRRSASRHGMAECTP